MAEEDKLFSPLWDLPKFQEKFKEYEKEINAKLERERKEKAKEQELKDHLSESGSDLRAAHKRHQSTIDVPTPKVPSTATNRAPGELSLDSRFRSTSQSRDPALKSRDGKTRA